MKNHFRAVLIASAAALTLAAAPLINWGAARAQSAAVTIQNFSFQPGAMTVPVGATVTWTNTDSTEHTVTSDTAIFDSGALSQNGTFSHTFSSAGTFSYHCSIHTYMTGTITVSSGAAPTATSTLAATPTNTSTSAGTATPTTTSPPATDTPVPAPTDTPTPVPPAAKKLSLKASPSTINAGKSSTVSVSVKKAGTSAAVKGAAITLDGRSVGLRSLLHAKSDAHGKASFKSIHPSRRGSIHLTATKSGFKLAKATIKVH
jgi:plastocyanin